MDVIYESDSLLVADNFLPDPDAVRSLALETEFIDWEGPDGQVYKRVAPAELPEVVNQLSSLMGRTVEIHRIGFRLNYAGEAPNKEIHSDLGWGTHAAVLYLSEPPEGVESGTAFWKHKATGAETLEVGQVDLWYAVRDDWDNADAWDQTRFVSCKYNSCTVYRSSYFHSRWPFEAYGTTPEDGRLTVVAFFS